MMGHSSAPTATWPPPPPPPMPNAGMTRQYTMGHTPARVESDLGKYQAATTALDSSDSDDDMPVMAWPTTKSTNWGSESDDDDDTL